MELIKQEQIKNLSKYWPSTKSLMVTHLSFVRNVWVSATLRVTYHPFTYPYVWIILTSNSFLSQALILPKEHLPFRCWPFSEFYYFLIFHQMAKNMFWLGGGGGRGGCSLEVPKIIWKCPLSITRVQSGCPFLIFKHPHNNNVQVNFVINTSCQIKITTLN